MGYKNKKDPFRKREQAKYANPIPSREYILEVLESEGEPLNQEDLESLFELGDSDSREGLRRRLIAMCRDGELVKTRGRRFAIAAELALLSGTISTNRDGDGYLMPDDRSPDIYMPYRQMRGLLNGDHVMIRVIEQGGRKKREGVIVEVLARKKERIVGRLIKERGIYVVAPVDKDMNEDVVIPNEALNKAKPGQYVEVHITAYPERRRPGAGEITRVLGDEYTPGMEMMLAASAFQLPVDWPVEVDKAVAGLSETVAESDKQGRVDLRDLHFVTIDGEDARDFDDAVYCERDKKGWTLWVAIADVSHYVRPGEPLDTEAYARGNSVYFPSRVIPMLPEVLSNGLCSLKPQVDRLAMVCEMHLSAAGEVHSYKFYEAVIHSHARLIYEQVQAMHDGQARDHADLHDDIAALYDLYTVLQKARQARGAVEFETVETQIKFDANGKIADVVPRHRVDAHKLIEEMMLAANVSTAKYLDDNRQAALFRNHEQPELERLNALRDFLKAFGLQLKGGATPTAGDYNTLLQQVGDRKDAHLIKTVLLRSMQQAKYEPNNLGHFGLGYDAYTHFTSPIRRYPDLLVHRAIKKKLAKQKVSADDKAAMLKIGEHCSTTERRADRAVRQATDWLKCEYMLDRIGEEFDAVICDVVSFGVFVELVDIYVQGLIHVTDLPHDYYVHDQTHHLMRGKRSGRTFRLGDALRVRLVHVNLDEGKVDFELCK